MKNTAQLTCLLALLFTLACNYKKEIPVIGIDSNGNPMQTLIPAKEYSKRLEYIASTFQDSAIAVLNQRSRHSKFKLRTVALGVGISTELNFGGLFKIGAYPRFRLIFCSTPVCTLP